MTVSFCTLGCKVNQYESEAVGRLFEKKGYTVLPPDSEADIVIINSCTVTAESNRKTRQTVRRIRRDNPKSVVVLTGCMAEAFPEEAAAVMEADIVVGNTAYDKMPEVVERFLTEKSRIFEVEPHKSGEKFTNITIDRFSEHTRAYIKIEDGCDRFCSYCIIPFARGRVRSKPVKTIAAEAECLAKAGYKEIVLVGINLSAYGKDTDSELSQAVIAAAKPEGIFRVRLGSLECDQISDETLTALKNCGKFCPQFHLSLQSGCDRTLAEMNRRYDTAFYRDLVGRIREKFDNPSVTTDVMVGFAGETDEDFTESCNFVKEIGFARSHVFVYSVRKGTKAALRTDMVDPARAHDRSIKMQKICAESERQFLMSQVGKTAELLFESSEDGIAEGYTENYTRVKVKSDENLSGKIRKVKIVSAENDFCIGRIAES